MNNDTIAGNWRQLLGEIKIKWKKLTDDHTTEVNGSREKLAEILQEKYGIASEEANKQIADWENFRKKKKQMAYKLFKNEPR